MPTDPANLHIVFHPAPVLREKAQAIAEQTEETNAIARKMIDLMREAEGIGLAAPQVGLPIRMFVAEVPEGDEREAGADPPTATTGPIVFINPELSAPSADLEPFEEGCLSLPEIRGDVRRPSQITVTATGLDGERFTFRAGGLLARCIQHENDHLDGVLIIDKFTHTSRLKNRASIRRLEKAARVK